MADEQRSSRLKEAIRGKTATFLSRESNYQSLITVTDIQLSGDQKRALILVTVLPVHKEKAAIDFLKRQRSALRKFLQSEIRVRSIPFLDFAIDLGEKNRQRIDEISNKS